MRRCLQLGTLLLSTLLMACSSLPPAPPPPPASLWHDAAFAPVAEALEPEQAMAISEPMRQYLHREMAPLLKRQGPVQGLVTALTQPAWLKLQYDASATRTAAQAFESRSGNCLSLVILTAALAKELGLQAHFQEVVTDELWSRQAGLDHSDLQHQVVELLTKRGQPLPVFAPSAVRRSLQLRPCGRRSVDVSDSAYDDLGDDSHPRVLDVPALDLAGPPAEAQ